MQTGMTSTALSPNITASSALDVQEREEGTSSLLPGPSHSRISPHEPRGSIPQMMMQNLGEWQPQYASATQYQGLPAAGRPSWDMGAYLQQGPTAGAPALTQPLQYYPGAQSSEQTSASDEKPYSTTTQQTMAG